MKERKVDLIKRWTTDSGIDFTKKVIRQLKKKRPLKDLLTKTPTGIFLDLRGFNCPKKYFEYNYRGKEITQVLDSIKFKNISLSFLDFSYADLRGTVWKNCSFENLIFDNANAENVTFINCTFKNIHFHKVRFTYSVLNRRYGTKSGHFSNITFSHCSLNQCRLEMPLFTNCVFNNCNLTGTDFDGSRFSDCKFIGKVKSCWFRGYSITEFRPNFFFNRIDKKRYRNTMRNVDFSEAAIDGVCFTNEVDLSSCIIPNSDNYILLKDEYNTFKKIKLELEKYESESREKMLVLDILDIVFLNKKEKTMSIINLDFFDSLEAGIREQLTELIRTEK